MRAHARLRLLPVVAGAWVTAFLTITFPLAAGPLAAALWALALCGLAVAARGVSPWGRIPVIVVLLALVAAASTASHVAFASPARESIEKIGWQGGRALEVEATVVGKVERWSDGSLAFDARAVWWRLGPNEHRTNIEVVVVVAPEDVDALPGALDVGAVVRASGTATATDPGDRAVVTVRAARGVTVVAAPSGALSVAAGLRQGLVASASGLPGAGAGLIPGLAVGDTSAVTAELDVAMKASSLSHLTAVSGANCALVVALTFSAAAALGAGRRLRVIVGLVSLAGFVLLVTPEPSVVRAATMAAVAMGALLLGRVSAGMAVLSLAVTVLLIADPWLAASLGFALSAAATASLLLFVRPLTTGLARFLPRSLALALAVPLAAQLVCGPLLVLIAPSIPMYGVVANLLAGPAAPVATIVGLAACLAAPVPWVQYGLTAIAWLPASWIATTATTIAGLPGNLLPWGEGLVGAALLSGVGLAIGLVITGGVGHARVRSSTRAVAAAILAVVVGVSAGWGALGTLAGPFTLPQKWSVLACDVGQGDAVLLRSAGQVALVDTGPDPAKLDECLARAGIQRLDLLVVTHFDLDHVGGIAAVEGRVGMLLHGPITSPEDERLLRHMEKAGASPSPAAAGQQGTLGAAQWRVLWPAGESRAFSGGNDASVVLDIRGGGIPATILLGDLSASPQRALIATGDLRPPYAVVKVAHHGSADQEPELYAMLAGSLALVTVGIDNDYGHPRDEALAPFIDRDAAVARTDTEGILAVWLDGSRLSLWREHVEGHQ
ncbi:ComEC/Rec2 family competence protein [Microbacterium lacus]|uniref:ComEC/Rec2 family competence protein n=1 Tax=Microbacterium lacus TaxID=415217 RepID=UPI00384F6CD6